MTDMDSRQKAGPNEGRPFFSFPVRPRHIWRFSSGKTMTLGRTTRVMGILNVTPDSFSDGGRFLDTGRAIARGETLVAEGADLIDIGGESTRPGAGSVGAEEELRRIIPVITGLQHLGVPLSVDTTRGVVARRAMDAGADIINDISGLRFDPDLAKVVAETGAGLILMHSRGTPRDMQSDPRYDSVMREVIAELGGSYRAALEAGVSGESIVVDPGLGFSKTAAHNLEILNHLNALVNEGRPVLVGASRKSFIGKALDLPVDQRLEGSLTVAVAAVMCGAHLVRVHDVRSTVRAVRTADAILEGAEAQP